MRRMPKRGLLAVVIGGLVVLSGCFLLPNRSPTAAFAVRYNEVPGEPLVVLLDASLSTDPDNDEITSYLWTFGDDVQILTPLEFSKTVHVPELLVRYPVEGTYTAQLLVIDERGSASEVPFSLEIIVPNLPVVPMP